MWPKLAVYDIEAVNWVEITLIGHVDEMGNRKCFPTVETYLNWLYKDSNCTHVWAHWGGHYDHRFLIAYATRKGWSWQTVQSGNLLIIIKIKHPETGREISFCESARLMPDSVEKIGKTVGLRKLDVDRAHIEKLTQAQVEEYCLRDCDIVLLGLQFMRDVLSDVNCDFAYTLASIATRWVRRSDVLEWMCFFEKNEEEKWEYSPQMLKADEFCLPAYFGGRVEVFRTGIFKKKLYYYDITSSYPWSMTHPLPTYFKGFFPPPKDLLDALQHPGISEATIHIPKGSLYLPLLPYRFKGKLIFPEGTFRGRWTNLELLELHKRMVGKGGKIQIHGQARFEELAFLKPFVDTFYGLRFKAKQDGDEFRSYTFKILLNSLYGKLVENIERKSILHGDDFVNRAIEDYGPKSVIPTTIPGIFALITTELGPFRHVAAGSYVTARSRLRLLEGLEACTRQGAKVYYCDTDSIVTDQPIKAFETDDKNALGTFKFEDTFTEAEFIAPKVYRAITSEGKILYKVKGMPIKGLDENEKRIRWDMYNYHTNPLAKKAIDRLNLTDEKQKFYSSKDGIGGFNNDLNKGIIEPRRQILQRQQKNHDSKREHKNNDSIPHYINKEFLSA